MEYINKAIEHTPTVLELYIHKAKLYQRMGNAEKAANFTEEARILDLADRYLNAHSSKYLFKDNKILQANQTMALFSREQDCEKLNVHEMSTFWYELHSGLAHFRLKQYRLALKELSYFEKHFSMMNDDCLDFFYCSMRRGTVLHYLNMFEWQSSIFKSKWAVRGCIQLLKTLKRIQSEINTDEKIT